MATALILLRDNETSKLWFQRRDSQTEVYPNLLTFFGGAIEPSEDPRLAAQRELEEETSIRLNTAHLAPIVATTVVLVDSRSIEIHLFEALHTTSNFKVFEGQGAEAYTKKEVLARNDLAEVSRLLLERYVN